MDIIDSDCPICEYDGAMAFIFDEPGISHYQCTFCGIFSLSELASKDIKSKISGDSHKLWSVRHFLNTRQLYRKIPVIDSTNINQSISLPHPNTEKQRQYLTLFMKNQIDEIDIAEGFGVDDTEIEIDSPRLLNTVGSADISELNSIIDWGLNKNFIQETKDNRFIKLTDYGLNASIIELIGIIDEPQQQNKINQAVKNRKLTDKKFPCPKCNSLTNGNILWASVNETRNDADSLVIVDEKNIHVIKCAGCDTLFVALVETSTDKQIPTNTEIEYWPKSDRRRRPIWIDQLNDFGLVNLLNQIYGSINENYRTLAAIGARTALDATMVLLGAHEGENFKEKMISLKKAHLINEREIDVLSILTDAGSAAAHRNWEPTEQQLDTVMNYLENFLHNTLILSDKANELKSQIPTRPHKKVVSQSRPK